MEYWGELLPLKIIWMKTNSRLELVFRRRPAPRNFIMRKAPTIAVHILVSYELVGDRRASSGLAIKYYTIYTCVMMLNVPLFVAKESPSRPRKQAEIQMTISVVNGA